MVHGHGTRYRKKREQREQEQQQQQQQVLEQHQQELEQQELQQQLQQQQIIIQPQQLQQHQVVVATPGAHGLAGTQHLVVHDASGNPVLVQTTHDGQQVLAVQGEEIVTAGDPSQQQQHVTVLEVNEADDVVGIVAGLEEAADQLLEQEKHVEAARATANLLNDDPTLKKEGAAAVAEGAAVSTVAGITTIIQETPVVLQEAKPEPPPVPDRTEEYGINKPLPDMSKPLKQIYTCDQCGEMYQGFNFYQMHLKEEHGEEIEESEETEWKPNFIIHAGRGRTPPPDYRELECPKCEFIASEQSQIDDHMDKEHKPKPRLPCHECDKTFARKWELQVHVKTVHLGIKDQQCPQCDYRSADKGRVQKHLRQVHWKVRDYHCDQCDYKGSSVSALKNHVKAIHLKLREYKCQYCDHTAVQKGQIVSHMRTVHLNIKPYHCNQCEFRAADNGTLKKHIRVKHDKIRDHICQHCGYGSSSAKQLESHIEKKHINPKRRKLKPIPIVGMRLKTDWVPPPKPRKPAGGATPSSAAAAAMGLTIRR